jgi:endo-alpha-1,4-polygalactosaminidase (GH114 family)
MAPYTHWALESFKHILVDSCDEYFNTNDRGNDKSQSKLITQVTNDIAAIAQDKKQHVPDDLEKVTF